MVLVTASVRVSGRVQGVSFRAAMMKAALDHGVEGWVRNNDDGSVEALLQGDETSVRKLVEWARVGPPRASVTSLTEKKLLSHPRQRGFRITA